MAVDVQRIDAEIASDFEKKAYEYFSKCHFDQAITFSSQALTQLQQVLQQVEQELIKMHILRSKAYLAQKKYFRAKQDCDVALAYGRNDAQICLLSAKCLEGLCQREMAEASCRRALILDPQFEEARQMLKESFELRYHSLPPLPLSLRLPDELWVKIFGYLDIRSRVRIESVCRRWSALALRSWHGVRSFPPVEVCLEPGQQRVVYSPDYFAGLLGKCGQFCTSVDLNAVDVARVRLEGQGRFRLRNKLRHLMQIMADNCTTLQHFIVPTAAFIDEDLTFIFSRFRQLKSLCLEKVGRTPEGRLTGEALGELPPCLEELRLHFVQSCPCLADSALGRLAQRGANYLKHIKLFSEWDSFPSESALISLISQCENLRSVKLGCLGREASESLTTSCLEQLGRLHHLTDLYAWAPRISASVISAIVEGCPKLTSLELHAESMEADALTRVANFKCLSDLRLDVINGIPWASLLPTYAANNCSTLKIVALNGLRVVDLFLIVELFPQLEQLCLWNSVDISAQTLVDLIKKHWDRPKSLKLIGSCYHVQMTEPLASVLAEQAASFAVGCYYDHRPCDLNGFLPRVL